MDYNATLTITPSSPVEDDDAVDVLMEAFAAYHPAVGDTALAAQVGDLVGIEVIPTQMWDRREGLKVDDVELVSVTEAATILGLTNQAVRDRITAGTLPGRKIGRNWLVPTAALAN